MKFEEGVSSAKMLDEDVDDCKTCTTRLDEEWRGGALFHQLKDMKTSYLDILARFVENQSTLTGKNLGSVYLPCRRLSSLIFVSLVKERKERGQEVFTTPG